MLTPTEEERKAALRPPPYLSARAKREFRRVVLLLLERQHWDTAFVTTVAIHAQETATYIEARGRIEQEGMLIEDAKGNLTANPWIRIANQARDAIIRLAPEMGLTVAGFVRITAKNADGNEKQKVVKSGWDTDLLA